MQALRKYLVEMGDELSREISKATGIPFGGGLPIFEDGIKVGAIGVSGGTEEEDIICAQYAIEKIGLK